jgi:GMP synthase (glutamine-hydrolysing)
MAQSNGGLVEASDSREYGRANLEFINRDNALFAEVENGSQVWMSHGDTIMNLPEGFEIIASTRDVKVAGYHVADQNVYGIQFHPEVYHTTQGAQILRNFVVDICGCVQDWSPAAFVESTVEELRTKLGDDRVLLGLSGGVDSSVAAMLLHKAIGENLTCIFVDNGLLRKNEYENVLDSYKHMGLNVIGVDAKDQFLGQLTGVSDPETKRKIIGRVFIETFDIEAHKIQNVKWLAQGTIYPDVIESVSVNGPSVTIKSHHNVGGLPDKMNLKVVEPLKAAFQG